MYKRIFLFALIVLSIAAGAIAYNKYITSRPPSNEFQVRSVVSGFGDEIGQVSLSTTTEAIAKAMDQHYSLYIHPTLLGEWKATPTLALGRLATGEPPDRINIESVTKNADGTYTIDGVVTTRLNARAVSTMPGNIPVRFTLTQGPDGWQITSYVVRPPAL